MNFVNVNNPLLRRQAASASPAQKPAQQRVAAQAQPRTAPIAAPRTQAVAAPVPRIDRHASREDEQLFDETGTFNPLRYAGGPVDQGAIRRSVTANNGRIYDRNGQVQSYDNKDALQQVAYLLGQVTKQSPIARATRLASKVEKDERRKVLAAALSDPTGEGFALVGQELLLPIKAIVDYEGFSRKIFRPRHLEQGELFRIPKDVRSTAYIVGQDGQSIESRLYGQYIQPSEFKVTSFPTVDLIEIWQLNFDVLDRAQDTARQEIELEEDKAGVRLLDRAASAANTVTSFATMGVAALEAVRYQVERHRLIVDKFLINRQEVSDVMSVMSTQVDPVTQRELNMAGYLGSFLGAHVITAAGQTGTSQEVIQAGTFYACTAPEYLGEMGVRVELFSEPFNGFAQRSTTKGWAFVEVIGFGIPSVKAVAKGVKA